MREGPTGDEPQSAGDSTEHRNGLGTAVASSSPKPPGAVAARSAAARAHFRHVGPQAATKACTMALPSVVADGGRGQGERRGRALAVDDGTSGSRTMASPVIRPSAPAPGRRPLPSCGPGAPLRMAEGEQASPARPGIADGDNDLAHGAGVLATTAWMPAVRVGRGLRAQQDEPTTVFRARRSGGLPARRPPQRRPGRRGRLGFAPARRPVDRYASASRLDVEITVQQRQAIVSTAWLLSRTFEQAQGRLPAANR